MLALLQARVWLWLWPLQQAAATNRAGEPNLNMFYYAMVIALGAAICLHYRLMLRSCLALMCLLFCWVCRALMA
jgi:hypothetical protein